MDIAVAEPLLKWCRESGWHPLDILPLLGIARGWHVLSAAAHGSPYVWRGLSQTHPAEVELHRAYLEYARQVEQLRESLILYAAVWRPHPLQLGRPANPAASWVTEPALQQPVLRQRVNQRPPSSTPDVHRYLERLEREVGCPLPLCYVAFMEAACQPELESQGQDALPPLGELRQHMHWTARTRPMFGLPGMSFGHGVPAPGEPRELGASSPTIKRTESSVRFEIAHMGEQSDHHGFFVHTVYLEWRLIDGVAVSTQYVLAKISDYDPMAHADGEEPLEDDIATFATFQDVLQECMREYMVMRTNDTDGQHEARFRLSDAGGGAQIV